MDKKQLEKTLPVDIRARVVSLEKRVELIERKIRNVPVHR